MRRIDLIAIAALPALFTTTVFGFVFQGVDERLEQLEKKERLIVITSLEQSAKLDEIAGSVHELAESQRAFTVLDNALQPCKPAQQKDTRK